MDRHLVVFARQPRLGRVKTRLARDVGAVAAWAFHRRMVDGVTRRLGDPRWRRWLAVTPDGAVGGHPWPAGWTAIAQGTGDLGDRMARPLFRLPPGPVVIVGTDIPGIEKTHIARAFALLGDHDAVFGPAADGGFWLVGVRRRPRVPPGLYAGVRWSRPDTLTVTLRGLSGCRIGMIDALADVDDGAALAQFKAGNPDQYTRNSRKSVRFQGLGA